MMARLGRSACAARDSLMQLMRKAADVLARMAQLPFGELSAITSAGPLLVVAPHPDDESLGCGGLIARACMAGAEVHVAILTDGIGSHPNSRAYPPARLQALREAEAKKAVATLGVPPDRLSFLGYRDAAAPRGGIALLHAAQRLAQFTAERKIATVFSTWEHDPHCDHVSAHRIAALASGLAGFQLMSYAVWGWTLGADKWLPRQRVSGLRLDITPVLPVKRRAIACHRSQVTGMIDDDPSGFQLPQVLLEPCDRGFEVFLRRGTPIPQRSPALRRRAFRAPY